MGKAKNMRFMTPGNKGGRREEGEMGRRDL